MQDYDWKSLGKDIRDIVQDAVDTKDFRTLNQTLRGVMERTAEMVGDGLRSAGAAVEQNMGQRREKDTANADGKKGCRRPCHVPESSSKIFASTYGCRAGGMTMKITGILFGTISGIAILVLLLIALAGGSFPFGLRLPVYLLSFCFLGCTVLAGKGSSMRRMAARFASYIRCLRGRTYCPLEELAVSVDRPLRFVRKDLKKMFHKRWFLQGHLDRQETCLMVEEATYQQYLAAIKQQELRERQQPKKTDEKSEQKDSLPAEVRETIEEGRTYLAEIGRCNRAISGEAISAKISRMEMLVGRILARVEKNPEDVGDIRKLMEYYLPTTVKLLKAYEELTSQPVQGENIVNSKKEIEGTLDTLNLAFEKLLDSLFQDTAWDVSTDITVLKTMLAQEGLTEEGVLRAAASKEKGENG
ncbi:5-bromo-4-chloroindolyl phosphate hydrolysis family protein [Hominifimenecus sp. rT4P-3]|uniref:5-bromo-4-chloroindolyl phosphate hydrolysis family protein n=1 Tax=Hominifimenecus sp. rT4P-3 TaxID=3242979 RepID=UPI003DA3D51C